MLHLPMVFLGQYLLTNLAIAVLVLSFHQSYRSIALKIGPRPIFVESLAKGGMDEPGRDKEADPVVASQDDGAHDKSGSPCNKKTAKPHQLSRSETEMGPSAQPRAAPCSKGQAGWWRRWWRPIQAISFQIQASRVFEVSTTVAIILNTISLALYW